MSSSIYSLIHLPPRLFVVLTSHAYREPSRCIVYYVRLIMPSSCRLLHTPAKYAVGRYVFAHLGSTA